MASKAAICAKVCPVCLETRPLKIAGRCKHSVCTECLTTAIGGADGDVFNCPTCQADCPHPWDGVEGLVDFTGEEVAAEESGGLVAQEEKDKVVNVPEQKKKKKDRRKDLQVVLDVRCMICQHKEREVQAVNLCVECKNLYICGDCTEVHAKNKATKGHAVIPFQPEKPKKAAFCKEHNHSLESYCIECKQAVCVVCVILEHGDHTLENIGDLVDAKVEGLKVILEERKERQKKLQKLAKNLTSLTRIAPVVDQQDVLIKEIEDHAQKCIDKIVKWKEDLKGQVKVDYQIIHDIPECLKKVVEVIQKIREPIQRAEGLLAETEHQPVYLDRLMSLQEELEALALTGDTVQVEGYVDQLRELYSQDCCFTPAKIDSLGKIEKNQAEQVQAENKQIYENTMRVDKFIQCVANLGQRFAVAHATREGKPSNRVDIFKFPGKLVHTIRDHVPPLYDMSATPDRKLAVLSDGTRDTSCCVKLFDSEAGYISSTRNFNIANPLSLGVTLQHQYVILCDNEQGERQITVVDKDGRVEHTHVIIWEIHEKRIKPSRITCGGRFIYVIGSLGCVSYEIRKTGIHAIESGFSFKGPVEGVDISANIWDDLFISYTSKHNCYMNHWKKDKKGCHKMCATHASAIGVGRETTLSKRSSHIVISIDQTIAVYKVLCNSDC